MAPIRQPGPCSGEWDEGHGRWTAVAQTRWFRKTPRRGARRWCQRTPGSDGAGRFTLGLGLCRAVGPALIAGNICEFGNDW